LIERSSNDCDILQMAKELEDSNEANDARQTVLNQISQLMQTQPFTFLRCPTCTEVRTVQPMAFSDCFTISSSLDSTLCILQICSGKSFDKWLNSLVP